MTRVHSNHILPSDRYSFEVHMELLKNLTIYSNAGTKSIPTSMDFGATVPAQAYSLNARFLSDIRMIEFEKKGSYKVTPKTIEFVNASSVDVAHAKPILFEIIRDTWFAQHIIQLISTMGAKTKDEIINALAIYCQTDKNKKGAALDVLFGYIQFSEIVVQDANGSFNISSTARSYKMADNQKETNIKPAGTISRLDINQTGSQNIEPPIRPPAGLSEILKMFNLGHLIGRIEILIEKNSDFNPDVEQLISICKSDPNLNHAGILLEEHYQLAKDLQKAIIILPDIKLIKNHITKGQGMK